MCPPLCTLSVRLFCRTNDARIILFGSLAVNLPTSATNRSGPVMCPPLCTLCSFGKQRSEQGMLREKALSGPR